jgi:hypothetical protein
MAEVNQYTFTHRELIELLIKKADVHEGEWGLVLNMSVATGVMGPTPEQAAPGIMVTIPNIGIQRTPPGAPQGPANISVDAEKVNPKTA